VARSLGVEVSLAPTSVPRAARDGTVSFAVAGSEGPTPTPFDGAISLGARKKQGSLTATREASSRTGEISAGTLTGAGPW